MDTLMHGDYMYLAGLQNLDLTSNSTLFAWNTVTVESISSKTVQGMICWLVLHNIIIITTMFWPRKLS